MSTKSMVKLHNAFPARTAHPAVGEVDAGAERLGHGLDQQVCKRKLRQKSELPRGCAGDARLSSG